MGAVKNADVLIKVAIVMDDAISQIRNFKKRFKGLGESLRQNEVRFQGWALSIMFFGMAILRVFSQIAKTSVKTFQDVMHSVEGSVTSFDMLQGSIKFLQFTIGSVLEAFIPQIIEVVDKVSDWVNENQNLSGSIIKWGIILGAFLMVLGMVTLGFTGMYTLIANIGTLIAATFGVSGVAGGAAFKFGGIVLAIGAAFIWVYKMGKRMGGLGGFLNALGRGVLKLVAGIGYAVWGLLQVIGNAFKVIWNGIVSGVEFTLNTTIDAINALIRAKNKLTGSNTGELGLVDFSKAKAEITSMKSIWEGFISNMIGVENDLDMLAPMSKGVSTGGFFMPEFADDSLAPQQAPTVTNYYQQDIKIDTKDTAQEAIDAFLEMVDTNVARTS